MNAASSFKQHGTRHQVVTRACFVSLGFQHLQYAVRSLRLVNELGTPPFVFPPK
jgi:hypothetical protein